MTESLRHAHESMSLEELVLQAGHAHAATRDLTQAEISARLIRQMEADERQARRLGQELRWLTWATAVLAAVQVGLAALEAWGN